MARWDLIVVGAGPAGSAAALGALTANPAARVLLLDRDAFPRDKTCGDGIAPHALDFLADLGVRELTDGFAPVSRLRLGLSPHHEATGLMARPAYVIPRKVLDARLVAAAVARGAHLRQHRVRSVSLQPDYVVLDGELAGRTVVAADGAHSLIRRQMGIASPAHRHVALAIRGYAPVTPTRAAEQVIAFAPQSWPAYAWSFPIGDGTANVGYGELFAKGISPTRDHLLRRLDELLPSAATNATDWRAHHLPLSAGRPRQPDGRVLLAGDAASLINPLTGEGIYYAVISGYLAGRSAMGLGDTGRIYRKALDAALGRHLRHTSVAAALTRSPWVVKAGLSAASSDQRAFDELVEIGLGRGLLTPSVITGLARASASQLRGR